MYGRQFLQVKRPNQQYQSTEGKARGGLRGEGVRHSSLQTTVSSVWMVYTSQCSS